MRPDSSDSTIESHEGFKDMTPEDVLEQFVSDLKPHFSTLQDLLSDLLGVSTQSKGNEVLSRLKPPVFLVNDKNLRALNYLLSRKQETSSTKVSATAAEEILARVVYEFRGPIISTIGFMDLCKLDSITPERFQEFLAEVGKEVKVLVEDFKDFEANWETWLKAGGPPEYEEPPVEKEFRIQSHQAELLQEAKDKYLEAGLSREYTQRHKLYLEAGELFGQAMELGAIPKNLVKYAQGARRWAEFYKLASQTIYDPTPGDLSYKQLSELGKKDQIIIHRLVELGTTVRNLHPNDPTIVIEVPHNLADPLNIEIGFLLNELAPGDFAENLWELRSCKDISVDLTEIKTKKAKRGIRLVDSYPWGLKYYVYRFKRK